MTATVGPNLRVTSGWLPGDGGWGEGVNRNFRMMDTLIHLTVRTPPTNTPPASPTLGQRYLLAAAPTGAWVGNAGKVAAYVKLQDDSLDWEFYTPSDGWRAEVLNVDPLIAGATYLYRNGVWNAPAAAAPADLFEESWFLQNMAITTDYYIRNMTRKVQYPVSFAGSRATLVTNSSTIPFTFNIVSRPSAINEVIGQIAFAVGSLTGTFSSVFTNPFVFNVNGQLRVLFNTTPSGTNTISGLALTLLGEYIA